MLVLIGRRRPIEGAQRLALYARNEPTASLIKSPDEDPNSGHSPQRISSKRGRFMMAQLIMDHSALGCFGISLAPMRSLKRGPQYRIRFRCLLRWARRLHPFRMIIWLLVKCFLSSQHLLLRLKRLSRKWPSVAVIAAVYTIVMASMCIEPAAMSMHRTRCQRTGKERK